MKKLSLINVVVFLSINFSCLAQIDLKKVETIVSRSAFGKIFGNKIIFEGGDDPLGKNDIFLKDIENSRESVLVDKSFGGIPIGWVDSLTVLVLKYPTIYLYDIKTKKNTGEINDESISRYDQRVVNSEGILILFPEWFEAPEVKSFMVNLYTGEKKLIKEFLGKSIESVAYNKTNDILAFTWFNRKSRLDVLSVLNSGNLNNVTEFDSDHTIPLALSDDGQILYFVTSESEISKLYKYQLTSGKITELYTFEKDIICVDLSYSNKRLLLTLIGMGTSEEKKLYSNDSKYNYDIDLEVKPLSIYLIENPNRQKP